MYANYQAHQTPQFRVLSDGQIKTIYQATLECLNRTGLHVYNAEARELLARAGARVNGLRVWVPPHIIQDAVAASPRSFTLWGRDLQRKLQVVPDRVYFGPGPTCTYFVDPETGQRRPVRQGDPALTARVCDALPNIDYVMGLGLISDVHPPLAPVYEFAELASNTTKPILTWAYSVQNVADIYQIALAVAGDKEALCQRPFIAFFSTFQSPLVHTEEDLTNMMWAAEHNLPIVLVGGGALGSGAPITGAGSLVIYLAGALSGLAILQLKKRGTPVCIGGVTQSMDLRTARPAYGGPEMSLYSAAMSDISRHLGVPFMGTAGASEAKVVDLQAAIESTVQVMLSGLSGATLIHDVGFLDCAEIGSLEMLVMNDEIISMLRYILQGITVSDETLMLDLIDKVGPGGEFLSTKETARRCRTELWRPSMMDRNAWAKWQATGALTMQDRVKIRLQDILKNHQPVPLSDETLKKIGVLLEKVEARPRR
jgi:trimethylamine--corrinoid protein Co-methyltransferase